MTGPTAEEKGRGQDGKVDESHRTTLQDPLGSGVLGGRRERPGRQVEEAKARGPDSHF